MLNSRSSAEMLDILRWFPTRRQVLIEAGVIGVLCIAWLLVARLAMPWKRPFNPADRDIGLTLERSIVPSISLPFIYLLVTASCFCAVEFVNTRLRVRLMRNFACGTWKARVLVFVLAACLAGATTGLTTDVLKVAVARLRPNFLAQCKPIVDARNRTVCSTDTRDSRVSFPSGHASSTMAGCATGAFLLHAGLFRHSRALALLTPIIPLSLAVGVGLSRVLDHHHRVSDVLAGLALGLVLALAACTLHYRWPSWRPRASAADAEDSAPMVELQAS